MANEPRLLAIQVGLPQQLGQPEAENPFDRPWTTGFYKQPVAGPVWLQARGLAGDGQADLENHGGPDKAVCAYAAEHYPGWRSSLGLDLPTGAFGENFTIEALTEPAVCIGDVWRVGDVAVQVSQPRQPCWKLARRWRIKDLAVQVVENGRTGWYFRVLEEGAVEAGAPLTLAARPRPDWTIERANQVMHHHKHDLEAAAALADVPELSGSWRSTLRGRVARGGAGD
jgi:MOSC domain-containing protein YiiM